jgi:cytochrome c-type biogenesis protein CcmE
VFETSEFLVANGKLFYAKKNLLENQTGFDNTIKIGGINENAAYTHY